ncbi:MAG: hypothetical protein IJ548_03185 [Paludibacteraceae bacterium]|nr:hypothetical protein [Paludibacteraceae bacterium]MBQ9672583.1 hypothetical protein [Prevotella sp.]
MGRGVADYIRQQFGLKRKKEFMLEVDQAARKLMQSPNIGQIDPLYAERAYTIEVSLLMA